MTMNVPDGQQSNKSIKKWNSQNVFIYRVGITGSTHIDNFYVSVTKIVDVSSTTVVAGGLLVLGMLVPGMAVVGIVNVTAKVVLYSGAVGIAWVVVVEPGSVVGWKPSHWCTRSQILSLLAVISGVSRLLLAYKSEQCDSTGRVIGIDWIFF